MGSAPRNVVIVGGGSAGWIAACLIAHAWRNHGCTVTLVESPDVGIIGVGEGSTPQLKAFFDQLAIDERQWMPACDATYKLGIRFDGWSVRPGFSSYFHPFPSALDSHSVPQFHYNCRARRTGRDVVAHPDAFLLAARLAERGKGPHVPRHFPFEQSYGYHFDAYKLGAFLRDHAVGVLGVRHVQVHVADVERQQTGGIASLRTGDGAVVSGDLFIDCTGFRALLFGEALTEPFKSYADTLFNDRAVVMPTSRHKTAAIESQTRATALSSGWVWRIPLTSRTGNGYVYSSRHISDDDAEAELRAHLGPDVEDVAARRLTMRVGRMDRSWRDNALAIGLSQGFLEPLEATALHIVIATVERFIDIVDRDGMTASARDVFNADIGARYDGIRDYIQCHYAVNQRIDAAGCSYWADCRAVDALSPGLQTILSAWYQGEDMAAMFANSRLDRYYTATSWHCMLAGYGTFPSDDRLCPPGEDVTLFDIGRLEAFLDGCALNFIDQRAALGTDPAALNHF